MSDKIDEIKAGTARAEQILGKIRQTEPSELELEDLHRDLKLAICLRLRIRPEDADTDELRKLCILSIRSQDSGSSGLADGVIRRQIEKYDCHQTNLVAQKKVLLMLYIERTLAVTLNDEEAADILTVMDMAAAIRRKLQRG